MTPVTSLRAVSHARAAVRDGRPSDRPRRGLRFPLPGRMCYNRMAVKQNGKQEMAPEGSRGTAVVPVPAGGKTADRATAVGQEDPSRYCPICSERLESRRCKLVCGVCGYYMSCADYY
jgi:hypothetical protein